MTDANKVLQKLTDQLQSLQDDVSLLRQWKLKKRRSHRSRSRERHHRSRSRTRSNSPRRGRRSRSWSRACSPHVSLSHSRSPSWSRGPTPSWSRETAFSHSQSRVSPRSQSRVRRKHDGESRSRSRSYSRSRSRSHSRSRSRTRHSRSRSRSRTPSPVSKSRDWADQSEDPDYDEPIVFSDTETRGAKTAPPTRLVQVTDETAAFLKQACSKRPESSDRLSTRNAYALPKVPATKTAVLDAYMKPEVSQNGKATDKELGVIQTAILDSMAPPLPLLRPTPKVTMSPTNKLLMLQRQPFNLWAI
ncbi:luc7-like protein 3 [Dysidea avara]|uniref:luc7-like protein 3 n=1 Tax=Dysidea avara TaxID=196820 RepID=UPI00331D7884